MLPAAEASTAVPLESEPPVSWDAAGDYISNGEVDWLTAVFSCFCQPETATSTSSGATSREADARGRIASEQDFYAADGGGGGRH